MKKVVFKILLQTLFLRYERVFLKILKQSLTKKTTAESRIVTTFVSGELVLNLVVIKI